ncbi:hypothetical protein FOA52_002740 [Chlamydomonas sp. UWO 241]|nr:hypothetical protein FOA52_002740 [Chlamydomonas sp. UWO 241]
MQLHRSSGLQARNATRSTTINLAPRAPRAPTTTRVLTRAVADGRTAVPELEVSKETTLTPRGFQLSLSSMDEVEAALLPTGDWHTWMANQLAARLIGVEASTSRAKVTTIGVQSANVVKGAIRAEAVDVTLLLRGEHKEKPYSVDGAIRLVLKTEDNRDRVGLSDVEWTYAAPEDETKNVHADIAMAAQGPLESALANVLNDLLWEVEHHSIEEEHHSVEE